MWQSSMGKRLLARPLSGNLFEFSNEISRVGPGTKYPCPQARAIRKHFQAAGAYKAQS
jgi:hypothetical protein